MAEKGRTTRRVNLRIDEDVYLAFQKVADFFQQSTAALIRQSCEAAVPLMRHYGEVIDLAKTGNAEAAHKLMQAMLSGFGQQLTEAEQTIDTIFAEGAEEAPASAGQSAGASNTAL